MSSTKKTDEATTKAEENQNRDRLPFRELPNCNQGTARYDENNEINEEISGPDLELLVEKEQFCENEVTVNGYRIFDLNYLCEQLQEISQHNSPLGCNFNTLNLIREFKKGFNSDFIFICKMCNVKLKLKNCRKPKSNTELTLNENIVSSFTSIGAGFAGLEQVTASLEIPCMSELGHAISEGFQFRYKFLILDLNIGIPISISESHIFAVKIE